MNNFDFIAQLGDVHIIIKIIELFFIIIFTFRTFVKINNTEQLKKEKIILIFVSTIFIVLLSMYIENYLDKYLSWIFDIFSISFVNYILFEYDISFIAMVTIISFSISYVFFIISVALTFIPGTMLKISNDIFTLILILAIYCAFMYKIYRIKKVKYGFTFLKNKLKESSVNIIILNIASITLFTFVMLQSYNYIDARNIVTSCIIMILIMFFTIKQSFELYYKQRLLTKDLEETKTELEAKNKEINKLEKENLEYGKRSHSLAHKQKALEFKLENLMKTQIDEESKKRIKEEIEDLNKEVYKEPGKVELAKTGIESIDNMLSYMQSECIKDNIKFELQVVGNIYYMINNLITENDLEILIADHIKDAIFAINFSDNSNRSILVRIGKIDNIYSLYIYDSGIEFSKEVLDNLGKKPITTHAETGGTGMGFMNTFDTINKTKASFIINEIGKPCEDNYTKVLIFKFDNKNEFKVNSDKSYKDEVLAQN